ncbi:MAG: FkbM family methyltransferase [bacterium]
MGQKPFVDVCGAGKSARRNLLTRLKPYVEQYPTLAFTYRTLRNAWAFQKQQPQVTPYGIKLMGNRAMQTGTFETEEVALIKHLLADADVFVDVGANIGFYTCMARSLGKYTLAIEPLPQNLDYLYANLDANGWHDVEVYPVGLAYQPGLAMLYGDGTAASLVSGWASASPLLRRMIPLSTLDIVCCERFCGRRLCIKVDVEGAEYNLLQGAANTLAMSPAPVWIIEIGLTEHHPEGIHPHYVETFEIFWRSGYRAWTANLKRRAVSFEDVEQWAQLKRCESGTINYLFEKS